MQKNLYEPKSVHFSPAVVLYVVLSCVVTYLFSGLSVHGTDPGICVAFIVSVSIFGKYAGFLSVFMLVGAFSYENVLLTANAVFSSAFVMLFTLFSGKKNNFTLSLSAAAVVFISGFILYMMYSPADAYLLNTAVSAAEAFVACSAFTKFFTVVKYKKDISRLTASEDFSWAIATSLFLAGFGRLNVFTMDVSVILFTAAILYLGRYVPSKCMAVGMWYGFFRMIYFDAGASGIVFFSALGYFASVCGAKKNSVYFCLCFCATVIFSSFAGTESYGFVPEIASGIITASFLLPLKDRFSAPLTAEEKDFKNAFPESMDMMISKEISLGKNALKSLVRGIREDMTEQDIYLSLCRETVSGVCMKCENYPLCWIENGRQTYETFRRDVILAAEGQSVLFTANCDETGRKELTEFATAVYVSLKAREDYAKKTVVFFDIYRRITKHLCNMLDTMALTVRKNLTFYSDSSREVLSMIHESGIKAEDAVISSDMTGEVHVMVKSFVPLGENAVSNEIRRILSSYLKRSFSFSYSEELPDRGYIYMYDEEYERTLKISTASRPKNDEEISGDCILVRNFSHMQLCAIADGMGSGRQAGERSRNLINMTDALLCAGYDYESAVEMINGILTFGETEEVFTTLDMLLFDRRTSKAVFFKAGAESSYIKRGDEIIKISCETLPVGILESTHTKAVNIELEKGDYVYMFSDGIIGAFGYDEEYLKNLILKSTLRFPGKIAEEILNSALEMMGGEAKDDISVVVCKLR